MDIGLNSIVIHMQDKERVFDDQNEDLLKNLLDLQESKIVGV